MYSYNILKACYKTTERSFINMKEKIYTIPINEAIEQDSECPFCLIAKRLEEEAVDYTLGAAMMEPDYRILCNAKGFCNHHSSMLFKKPNKLSLALVLDTRLESLRKQFADAEKFLTSTKSKHGFLRRSVKSTSFPETPVSTCVICEKTNNTIERYAEVFFYMWKNDNTFRDKVINSKGFCIPHFYYLAKATEKHLKNPSDFILPMYEKQKSELDRIQEEIHRFTLKFDYRNKDMEWGNAKDAPVRTIEKLIGYIEKEETTK